MREVLRLVDFIGKDRVYVSIYENGSTDKPLLRVLGEFLLAYDIRHTMVLSDSVSDFTNSNRISLLAKYRNLAIDPLFGLADHYDRIVFINDVFHCLDDTLELLYQTELQDTDITCGFDYEKPGWLYDTWVMRTISGNQVRDFDYQGFFVYDPPSRARYELGLPVQGYSCWNGISVLNSEPFYKHAVRFRQGDIAGGECAASECQLIAKDFWSHGYGRVLMVPQAKVVYDLKHHAQVRADKLKLVELAPRILSDSRLQDADDAADARRKSYANWLGLSPQGGLSLDAWWITRAMWLGWRFESVWVIGRASEMVSWIWPAPDRILCFGINRNGTFLADRNEIAPEPVPRAASQRKYRV
eukprot:jgi/Hompol1/4744/HPOL_000501-RA